MEPVQDVPGHESYRNGNDVSEPPGRSASHATPSFSVETGRSSHRTFTEVCVSEHSNTFPSPRGPTIRRSTPSRPHPLPPHHRLLWSRQWSTLGPYSPIPQRDCRSPSESSRNLSTPPTLGPGQGKLQNCHFQYWNLTLEIKWYPPPPYP